jgi:hypothetical protein
MKDPLATNSKGEYFYSAKRDDRFLAEHVARPKGPCVSVWVRGELINDRKCSHREGPHPLHRGWHRKKSKPFIRQYI